MVYHLNQLIKLYNGRTVLNIKELAVAPGEVLALVGPSGAGKSTLLRLLSFLEMPSAGELCFQGKRVTAAWPDLAARREVTLVFQRPQLLQRTVRENIAYGLALRGVNKREQAAVEQMIERLGLSAVAGEAATTLSGGEMQRVALARALVLRPRVLLLDEPTANLDPYNVGLIERIVQEENATQGTTVVIVTHNIFQARRLAERVGLLLDGKLMEVDRTEAFFERPQRAETAAFLRGDLIY